MLPNFHTQLLAVERLIKAGQLREANRIAEEMLNLNPHSPEALHLCGVLAGLLGWYQDAEALLRRAASLDKQNFFIHYNLAKSLSEQERHREALKWHKKALELNSRSELSWLNYGVSLMKLNKLDKAVTAFDRALKINPGLAEAYNNKGSCVRELGSPGEALALYEHAIELKSDYAEAYRNLGLTLRDLNRPSSAIAYFKHSIDLQPHYLDALLNLGESLIDLKEPTKALEAFKRAVEIDSNQADAWNNQAVVLNMLSQHREALISHARAAELKPQAAEIWLNYGVTLNSLGRYSEALDSYDRALKIKPSYPDAVYNKALAQLSSKAFREGFQNYLSRWRVKNFPSRSLQIPLPQCSQESKPDSILLWAEQGLGDEIFFSGMLQEAKAKYKKIGLVADERLHRLFYRSFPNISLFAAHQVRSEPMRLDFEVQAPVGDLGHLLSLDEEKISATRKRFLLPDLDLTKSFESHPPFCNGKVVCGISWKSLNDRLGLSKSISLADLAPLFSDYRLDFVCLQYGDVDVEIQALSERFGIKIHKILDFDPFNDLDGLTAVIEACDLVISVSNVTAHIAGAIGKKGCVLIPSSIGRIWYWHIDDETSFWYPSLRLFYQNQEDGWSRAIEAARDWLDVLLQENRL